jgi:hypothetical protein
MFTFPHLARAGHTFGSSSQKLARAHSQNALAVVHDYADHLGRVALASFLNSTHLKLKLKRNHY